MVNTYFNFCSGQRYYHMVALKIVGNFYSPDMFWRDCGVKRANIQALTFGDYHLQRGKLITNERYHDGEQYDFSVDGDKNEPPYQYDIFSVTLVRKSILIVGFPFLALAKDSLLKIYKNKQLPQGLSFLKSNLDKLIKDEKQYVNFISEDFTVHFSALELIFTGDTNISTVNLDGDKPLESNLYKSTFKKKIFDDECRLERCALRCETTGADVEIPRTKSNVHFDSFGNFKMYLHANGKNLFTIPFLFETVNKNGCLQPTTNNPVIRAKK